MSFRRLLVFFGFELVLLLTLGVFIATGFVPPSGSAPALHQRVFCLVAGVACGGMVALMILVPVPSEEQPS